jgi:hypothetical protein
VAAAKFSVELAAIGICISTISQLIVWGDIIIICHGTGMDKKDKHELATLHVEV